MAWLVSRVLLDLLVLALWTWWLARVFRLKVMELSSIQLEWEEVLAEWQEKAEKLEERLKNIDEYDDP